jgi:hypothetical protein
MKMPDVDISTAGQEDDQKATSEDADAEPFAQTMRIPVSELDKLSSSAEQQPKEEDYEKTMTVSLPDIGKMERKLRAAQEENPETDPFLNTIPQ